MENEECDFNKRRPILQQLALPSSPFTYRRQEVGNGVPPSKESVLPLTDPRDAAPHAHHAVHRSRRSV